MKTYDCYDHSHYSTTDLCPICYTVASFNYPATYMNIDPEIKNQLDRIESKLDQLIKGIK